MSANDSDDRADERSSPAVQNEPDVNVKQEEEDDDDELEQYEEEGSGEDELPEDEDEGEQEIDDDDDEKDGNSAAGRAYFKIEDRVPPPTSVYRTIREIHGEHPRCIVVNQVSHEYA
jgi:hypothetical protein